MSQYDAAAAARLAVTRTANNDTPDNPVRSSVIISKSGQCQRYRL